VFGGWAILTAALMVAGGLVTGGTPSTAAEVDTPTAKAASTTVDSSIVQAADLSQFSAGNIVSDAVFFNSATMTEAQIQSFLESKVSSCRSGYVCLKDYGVQTRQIGPDAMCGAYSGGGSERASRVIYKVAQACGINPQVILVMLQKEQGLVTSTAPSPWAYQAAMGQGCPDTAACDSQYYGLFNQIYGGAWQLKRYANPPGTSQYFTWYAPGKTWNIGYHPNSACGRGAVHVENQATANLYYYTPYQPNAAALRAGYGTGDGCSSYGNRNFYNYFSDWFGSTQSTGGDPFGGFNLVVERGQFTVEGWAIDRDTMTTSLDVTLAVDGEPGWGSFTANAYRPDVGAAYSGAGDYHGMDATFEIVGGEHTVCVSVTNIGKGANVSFGCATIEVVTSSPYGGVTIEAVPGGTHITGWTLDTDTTDPLAVHIYADGKGEAYTANAYRPDVGAVFPGMGDYHGIDITMALSSGTHEVCAYGIDSGPGLNVLLGCSTVTVLSGSPFGGMNTVVTPGEVTVQGWAIDPSTTDPIKVHVYVDGRGTEITADASRPDVGRVYPDYGSDHGIDGSFTLDAGEHTICAYGINRGLGSNSLLGCSTVTVLSGSPFGGMNTVVTPGEVTVQGWAIDPDTTDPIKVHVYVDGRGTEITADASRPDVGRVYPGYGSDHGIDATFALDSGTHTVCAYGINTSAGSNTLLGCNTVNAPSSSPFGGTDVTVTGDGVRLRGWTIDPNTYDPLVVHIYVDGRGYLVTTANSDRPDVGQAYPSFGSLHGVDTTFTLEDGAHQICSYAINVGTGGNSLLACQTVTIGSPTVSTG
jgi:hypothetical protein